MTTYSVIADIFMGGTVPIPFFPTWLKTYSGISSF